MTNSDIKLGVTLYSFTNEYYDGRMSFEDILAKTHDVGAKGIEIVASQMIPGYPWPTMETINHYKKLFRKYDLEPVCYGANVDRGLRTDRSLTREELFRSVEWDIRSAAELGCNALRTQVLLSPEVLEEVIPLAEKYGVRVGVEVHNPMMAKDPDISAYIEMLKRVNSPWIGFVPDFGMLQECPDRFARASFLEAGAREEVFDLIGECAKQGLPKEEALDKIRTYTPTGPEMGALEFCYVRYKPSDFEDFKKLLPYVVHCHGKFYYINEDYRDPTIPYPTIIQLLKKSGFKGYIVSEFEGHMFGDRADVTEMLRRHLILEQRLLDRE